MSAQSCLIIFVGLVCLISAAPTAHSRQKRQRIYFEDELDEQGSPDQGTSSSPEWNADEGLSRNNQALHWGAFGSPDFEPNWGPPAFPHAPFGGGHHGRGHGSSNFGHGFGSDFPHGGGFEFGHSPQFHGGSHFFAPPSSPKVSEFARGPVNEAWKRQKRQSVPTRNQRPNVAGSWNQNQPAWNEVGNGGNANNAPNWGSWGNGPSNTGGAWNGNQMPNGNGGAWTNQGWNGNSNGNGNNGAWNGNQRPNGNGQTSWNNGGAWNGNQNGNGGAWNGNQNGNGGAWNGNQNGNGGAWNGNQNGNGGAWNGNQNGNGGAWNGNQRPTGNGNQNAWNNGGTWNGSNNGGTTNASGNGNFGNSIVPPNNRPRPRPNGNNQIRPPIAIEGARPPSTPPPSPNCNCPATSETNPVCGTDGSTYSNPSRLRCARVCRTSANVQMQHFGACAATPAPETRRG